MDSATIIAVTPENAANETLFCVKDVKSAAFDCKQKWFEKRYQEGLRIKILKAHNGRMIGFIEYVPIAYAWRPVEGQNFMFVHCMYVYSKKDRNKGYGALLIDDAEKSARAQGMSGVCVMTSNGSWMTNKTIFQKRSFRQDDQRERFELMCRKWHSTVPYPSLVDWTAQQAKYKGWHLIYANQCPWHEKSVEGILNVAMDFDIHMNITELKSAKEAKNAPSGHGVFALMHNGKLIEDHYVSATRFRNILKKELKVENR
ncbi:GNAT family N-acetyltransferase [uncultured Croceitalea sp.]|uniref:GNAT family N-acetyltransferase n=1 Tax=uncultured Croceitalea sp. TaxID=1798908 RepID=UPI003305D99D